MVGEGNNGMGDREGRSWQKPRDWWRYRYGWLEYVWTLVIEPGLALEGLEGVLKWEVSGRHTLKK